MDNRQLIIVQDKIETKPHTFDKIQPKRIKKKCNAFLNQLISDLKTEIWGGCDMFNGNKNKQWKN